MKQVTFTDQQYQSNMQLIDIAIKAGGLQCMNAANQALAAMGSAQVIENPAPAGEPTPPADVAHADAKTPAAPSDAAAAAPANAAPAGRAPPQKARRACGEASRQALI